MINNIKNLLKKNTENYNTILDENIKRFEYIANSISTNQVEIIESNDCIGGYYENKLILPKNIIISKNVNENINYYIYKIIFSIFSKNLNFYLPKNKKDLDYISLASILTVKTVNKKIKNKFPAFNKLIRKIHPKVNKTLTLNNSKNRQVFIQALTKKMIYEKAKNITYLNDKEKILIYEIENLKNITNYSFKKKLTRIYENITMLYPKYEKTNLNILWGYLYYKENKIESKYINKILKKNKKTNETAIKKNIIKKNQKTDTKNIKNNLNLLFDYKKTADDYKKSHKNIDDNENETAELNEKNLDLNSSTNSKIITESTIKSTILNETKIHNLKNKKEIFKKYTYKEWDFKIKQYKKNWCNVFVKTEKNIKNTDKLYINKIKNTYKKEIKYIKEKIERMTNEKIWKKRYTYGENIDLDTIIDNYEEIKKANFFKFYELKKKQNKNLQLTILFDSSLSTDSYIKEKKIINFIKELIIILDTSLKENIKEYSIATFYSNTRHDCTYKIVKNFKEKKNHLLNINDITPTGYTRIGPAIRHAIKEITTKKKKKNIIILITDGNPTDYDEYEGDYGIKDIKMAITEAKKYNINVKTIILNYTPNKIFIKLFEKNNLNLISNEETMSKQITNFMKNALKD